MTDTTSATAAVAIPARNGNQRRTALTAVAIVVVLAAIGYGAWYLLFAGRSESTDNAYVQANVVQITPQVSGTVLAINADDTDFVSAGQTLVKLDPADALVATEQAEAQLAQTVREVRTLYTNLAPLRSQIAQREADLARARNDLTRAQDDVARREPLLATGAVGREEIDHAIAQRATADSAVAAAESALLAAREQLISGLALTDGTSVDHHPTVERAAARVREAYLALQRVELPAPVDGYVARRSVQLGQRVAAGAPLMDVVSLAHVWVDANFKEGQLRRLRLGQPAHLVADAYGTRVEYHGTVQGLGAGTGAAFALLPAQNATGNWIKVVQRVPVRIALDEREVAAHPLRVGLSMEVTVDVHDQSGKTLAEAPRVGAAVQTMVFDTAQREADAKVQRIVAQNLGPKVKSPTATVASASVAAASRTH